MFVVLLKEEPTGSEDLRVEFIEGDLGEATITITCDVQEERNIPAVAVRRFDFIPIVGTRDAINQDLDP